MNLPAPASSALPPLGTTHHVHEGKMDCRSALAIAAPPERVVGFLQSDWSTWWPHSAVKDRRPNDQGGHSWDFTPVAVFGHGPDHLHVEMAGPRHEALPEGGAKLVVPLRFSGDINGGETRFELYATADGGTILCSVWEGVAPAGVKAKGVLPELVVRAHLEVEGKAFQHLKALAEA